MSTALTKEAFEVATDLLLRGVKEAMRIAVCVVSLAVTLVTPGAAQKMTPEALVEAAHLQALTAGVPAPANSGSTLKGAVSAVTPARAAGLLPGTFRLTSGATGRGWTCISVPTSMKGRRSRSKATRSTSPTHSREPARGLRSATSWRATG